MNRLLPVFVFAFAPVAGAENFLTEEQRISLDQIAASAEPIKVPEAERMIAGLAAAKRAKMERVWAIAAMPEFKEFRAALMEATQAFSDKISVYAFERRELGTFAFERRAAVTAKIAELDLLLKQLQTPPNSALEGGKTARGLPADERLALHWFDYEATKENGSLSGELLAYNGPIATEAELRFLLQNESSPVKVRAEYQAGLDSLKTQTALLDRLTPAAVAAHAADIRVTLAAIYAIKD